MIKTKKIIRFFTGAVSVLSAMILAGVGTAQYAIPDDFKVTTGQTLQWQSGGLSIVNAAAGKDITVNAFDSPNQSTQAKLLLFGAVPVKNVTVSSVQEMHVIPCGTPFGIKMFTNGIMIVGVADIKATDKTVNPAAIAGIKVGDIILAVDGKAVNRNEEIAGLVEKSNGEPLKLSMRRGASEFSVVLQPVKSALDNQYKAGLWVRDSTAGIGTVTFYNPQDKTFGGLGHPICDVDTGGIMPLLNGDIVPVTINGITKGQRGVPGELRGYFTTDEAMGSLSANLSEGVYGSMNKPPQGEEVPVAMKQSVKKGPAKILATIDSGSPNYYDVSIESVNYSADCQTKNMVVRITDPNLISMTGGIVQGMSGCPILQDGKLVGAVTHVFVNDPTRGYGIFAENMLETAQQVVFSTLKSAS